MHVSCLGRTLRPSAFDLMITFENLPKSVSHFLPLGAAYVFSGISEADGNLFSPEKERERENKVPKISRKRRIEKEEDGKVEKENGKLNGKSKNSKCNSKFANPTLSVLSEFF